MMVIVLLLIAGVLGLTALGLGLGLVVWVRREGALASRGAVVQGQVVRHDYDGDGKHVPVIRFLGMNGAVHETAASDSSYALQQQLQVGVVVPVRFLPEDPSVARVDVASERRNSSLGFGIGFAICGLFAVLSALGAAALGGWLGG